jgi:ribosomal protein S18 acetylase RimI-like enzyme
MRLPCARIFPRQIHDMDQPLPASSNPAITLRPLRSGDIGFANELRSIAGWNQTETDWRGYLQFEPEGCFVAEVGGRAAGTATTIHYENKFGWIGMVLVHPEHRRLGLGSQLLRRAIVYLQERGVRCVKLDATPMGKKVYVPLGFVEEYELARYEGSAPAVAATAFEGVADFASCEFPAIVQLDTAAFGANRAPVLHSLSARNPDLCFAIRRNGSVAGYVIAREGTNAVQVGPWVARDAMTAGQLLAAFFSRVGGRRVFIDVVDPNPASVEIVKGHGFTVQRTLTRMFLGENAHPGDTGLIFGISSPEKG